MKRILTAVAVCLLAFSVQSSAQIKFGVTGGLNFNTAELSGIEADSRTGWNAGLTCLVDLPLGFSLQPSVVYSQKGANLVSLGNFNASQTVSYVEVPVSVQWGPDLLIFRPFIDVTPFVGYAVNNKFTANLGIGKNTPLSSTMEVSKQGEKLSWENLQRMSYGIGLGGGINVWKLQVIARYCWNLGSLYNVEGWEDIREDVAGLGKESKNFGGLQLGVSLFF